jgi:hypothetical protein
MGVTVTLTFVLLNLPYYLKGAAVLTENDVQYTRQAPMFRASGVGYSIAVLVICSLFFYPESQAKPSKADEH